MYGPPMTSFSTQIPRTLSLPAIELDGRSLSNSLVLLLYYSRCYRDYVRFQQVARPIAVTFDPHADELQYVGSANVRIGQDAFDHVLRYEEPFNPSPPTSSPWRANLSKPFNGDCNFHRSPRNSIYPLPSLICRRRTMTAAPPLLLGNLPHSVQICVRQPYRRAFLKQTQF
jgi:hypothetical protein